MSLTLKALVAAPFLAVSLSAAPALAASVDDDACCRPAAPPVASWLAPLDDRPFQQVRLFGLVEAPANEGVLDRTLRLVAGIGLVGLAASDPWSGGTALRAGAGAAGGVMLWTALTGACPAYMPFGLSTREHAAP